MSIKRILVNTIDTDLEYEVIGIDLAKNCVSAILLTTDGEILALIALTTKNLKKVRRSSAPPYSQWSLVQK